MFRSKKTKDQLSQLNDAQENPLRVAMRQRLGLSPTTHVVAMQQPNQPLQHHVTQSPLLYNLELQHQQPVQSPLTQHTSELSPMQRTIEEPLMNQSSPQLESSEDQTNQLDKNVSKLLIEVEIVDQADEVLRLQTMSSKDVYKYLKQGERILVHVNDLHQPIKAAGGLCTRFMTLLIEQPNLCPPDGKDWAEVKSVAGVRLLRELRAKFSLPSTSEVNKVLLSLFGSKFRSYRYRLKLDVFKKAKQKLLEVWKDEVAARGDNGGLEEHEVEFTQEELLQALDMIDPPSGFADHQWDKLKTYFRSTKAKELSEKGKAARATQIHTHTTGSTSYAQKKDEFRVLHKREPCEVEFFDIAHVTKKGSYVQEESGELMNVAKKKILEKMEELDPSERDEPSRRFEVEKIVMQDLMGPDRPGRARGYGIRVTKSQVTDFSTNLRRMQKEGSSLSEVSVLLNRLDKQDKVISIMQQTISELRGELQIFHTAFGCFGGGPMHQHLDLMFLNSNGAAFSGMPSRQDVSAARTHEMDASSSPSA